MVSMTDRNLGGIHETDTGAGTEANQTDEHQQRYNDPVFNLDKMAVGEQIRKVTGKCG